MEVAGYLPRIADAQLADHLRLFGAVEIAGTKWCGKTWTALKHGSSITYVDEDRELIRADPKLALIGEAPHVIDEWQLVPSLWDKVRHEVDKSRGLRGGWVLTGSSTPIVRSGEDAPQHSGAGRIGRVRMWPMSLFESGDSTGSISLKGLFDGEFQPNKVETSAAELVALICRGGWPEAIDMASSDALRIAQEYLYLVLEDSIAKHGKDPNIGRRTIMSLARNLGQATTYKTLKKDMFGSEDEPDQFITDKTLASYIDLFRSLYLIEEVRGWVPQTRSPKRFAIKPKRYFADPSLPIAMLHLNEASLLKDHQTLGLAFENLCVRDLSVYALALGADRMNPLRYYHDTAGLEVDIIIELADGRWAAIEVKLGEDRVPEAVASLKRLRGKVSENPLARSTPPAFMAVLTGLGTYAHECEEGIYAIPIRCLKD